MIRSIVGFLTVVLVVAYFVVPKSIKTKIKDKLMSNPKINESVEKVVDQAEEVKEWFEEDTSND